MPFILITKNYILMNIKKFIEKNIFFYKMGYTNYGFATPVPTFATPVFAAPTRYLGVGGGGCGCARPQFATFVQPQPQVQFVQPPPVTVAYPQAPQVQCVQPPTVSSACSPQIARVSIPSFSSAVAPAGTNQVFNIAPPSFEVLHGATETYVDLPRHTFIVSEPPPLLVAGQQHKVSAVQGNPSVSAACKNGNAAPQARQGQTSTNGFY